MAKLRVYELAKDLNMTNKELLDKLKHMDIQVRSHMSSLDDEVVELIKSDVLGKNSGKTNEGILRPTVIRRRKKQEVTPTEAIVHQGTNSDDSFIKDTFQKSNKIITNETINLITPNNESNLTGVDDISEDKQPKNLEMEKIKVEEPETQIENKFQSDFVNEIVKVEEPVNEIVKVEEPALEDENKKSSIIKEVTLNEEKSEDAILNNQKQSDENKRVATFKKDRVKSIEISPAPLKVTNKYSKPKKGMAAKIIKLPLKSQMQDRTIENLKPPFEERKPKEVEPLLEIPKIIISEEDEIGKEKKKKKWKKQEDSYQEPFKEKDFKDKKIFKKKTSFHKKEIIESADIYAEDLTKVRKIKKGNKPKPSLPQQTQITTPKAIKRRIKIDDSIIVSDLAKRLGVKSSDVISRLLGLGVMVTVNQFIDFDTAVLASSEFNYEVERANFEEETFLKRDSDEPGNMITRQPVVTIMGHVDHGKTSLLDVIRKTRIAEHEAGGITQHIGAYHVSTNRGQIVFLDTPGHEAFTTMRARGAQVTDIVVLVVAADDGVMPQTIEAINHAKAAHVPIIVAINKIDKPDADTDRVQRELSDKGLVPEAWGGDTIVVNVSAKKNIGIDDLLEMISIQAELLDLKADPNRPARGRVIEAKLDSGRGSVATVLIQEGTLKTGDYVVCGTFYGKIRAILDDRGEQIDLAGPSMPVAVLGLSGVPSAGEELIVLSDEKSAKQVSMNRLQKQRFKDLAKTSKLSLEKLYEKMQEGEVKELNLVIKADVLGSIEALKESLSKLSNSEVKINVIHSAAGALAESDISLASVSNAIIICFNVRPSGKIQSLANEEGVDVRYYNIIYNIIKDIQDAIVGMMASTFEERVLGHAEVREVFHVPKIGSIAGCYVTDGKIVRNQLVRLLRESIVIYEGKISSLRRFKDDVKEVLNGFECGIGIEKFNDIKVSDSIECYHLEEIKPEI